MGSTINSVEASPIAYGQVRVYRVKEIVKTVGIFYQDMYSENVTFDHGFPLRGEIEREGSPHLIFGRPCLLFNCNIRSSNVVA